VTHIARFKQIHKAVEAGKGFPEDWKQHPAGHESMEALFTRLADTYGKNVKPDTGEIEAIDIALDLELKSASYYMEKLPKAGSVIERRFLQELVLEEQDHHQALSDLRFYLTDTAGWFQEKEHLMMDGG
jgi:hypothetical protein